MTTKSWGIAQIAALLEGALDAASVDPSDYRVDISNACACGCGLRHVTVTTHEAQVVCALDGRDDARVGGARLARLARMVADDLAAPPALDIAGRGHVVH